MFKAILFWKYMYKCLCTKMYVNIIIETTQIMIIVNNEWFYIIWNG